MSINEVFMDSLIQSLSHASPLSQAAAVTVGGLVGVFATLGFFWMIIWLSGKLQKGEKSKKAS